jgi:hypothetical protein
MKLIFEVFVRPHCGIPGLYFQISHNNFLPSPLISYLPSSLRVQATRSQLKCPHFQHLSNNNNSIEFFIIYVPSQQPQGQLQTEHRVIIIIIIMIIIILAGSCHAFLLPSRKYRNISSKLATTNSLTKSILMIFHNNPTLYALPSIGVIDNHKHVKK